MKSISDQAFTFAYLSVLNKEVSPGVYNKILGTVKGAEKNGYKSRIWCNPPEPGFLKKMSKMIINSPEKVIMVRSLCQYNFFLIYAFLIAKMQGKKIILDVPTPNRVAIKEIARGDQSKFGRFKSLFYLIVSGPVPFWFVHKVVQYAREGEWFLLGNHNKTLIIGNGIDFGQFSLRKKIPVWPSDRLKLIVVASLNYWHGLDRLFKAMQIYNQDPSSKFQVDLTVVGEGIVTAGLKSLMNELKLKENIRFEGFLDGPALLKCYEESHIGVGSLALFRKNLGEASELKAREYTVVGLPFIASGIDPDFPEGVSFRYRVSNSEETESLVEFFRNFDHFYQGISFQEIRDFAKENLDYAPKFNQITQGL